MRPSFIASVRIYIEGAVDHQTTLYFHAPGGMEAPEADGKAIGLSARTLTTPKS